tara:strand:+ start:68 stop:322 length:255 start_codon:yes stop_codon:yes gene_type:complete
VLVEVEDLLELPLAVLLVLIQMAKVVPPLHLDILLLAVVMVVFTTSLVCMETLVDLVVVEHQEMVEELLEMEAQLQEPLVDLVA